MVVGRLLSYREGNFSGAMLNFGRVYIKMIGQNMKTTFRKLLRNQAGLQYRSQPVPPKKKQNYFRKFSNVGSNILKPQSEVIQKKTGNCVSTSSSKLFQTFQFVGLPHLICFACSSDFERRHYLFEPFLEGSGVQHHPKRGILIYEGFIHFFFS